MNSGLLGEMLIAEGLLDKNRLELGLEEKEKTGEKLGAVLSRMGAVQEEEVMRVLGIQLGMPFMSAKDYPGALPQMQALSVKFLKQYRILPIRLEGDVLHIAMADPLDPYPLEAIKLFTGFEIMPHVGTETDIVKAIDALYGNGQGQMEKLLEGMEERDAGAPSPDEEIEHLKDLASEAPVINLVNILITKAVEKRASDIHIEPFENALKVRCRIDGVLYPVETLPKKLHLAVTSRIKIMAKLNIAERRLPQDGRIKIKAAGKEMDIRVSTIPTLYGESVVLRLLDPAGARSLESIGFSQEIMKAFGSVIRQPHGMILVTGPTGSGKSTTLYAALSKVDTSEKKVITIEDPIEYNIEGINQIQVKPKIGFTFANGLRSIVRQDPDVIMVGEIRDAETAEIAIHSALTGHLILSTLHTNDAPGAVTRLMDMGIEGYLISSSLLAVAAQRLVRVICKNCKTEDEVGEELFSSISQELERISIRNRQGFNAYRGKGCELCGNTGYYGRTAIAELLTVTDDIRQLITEKKGSGALRQKAVEQGMTTLREDGWKQVVSGVTTIDEVSRVTLEQ